MAEQQSEQEKVTKMKALAGQEDGEEEGKSVDDNKHEDSESDEDEEEKQGIGSCFAPSMNKGGSTNFTKKSNESESDDDDDDDDNDNDNDDDGDNHDATHKETKKTGGICSFFSSCF